MAGYDYVLDELKRIPEDLEELLLSFQYYKHRDYKFNKIVFLGTGGGSRASFDILNSYLFDKSPYPIFIHQGYEIPNFVDKETLVFSVSYSGDTEETISSTIKAAERTKNLIIITKGGYLEKIALENNYPIFKLKEGYEARHALHLIFFSILKILSFYLNLQVDDEIKETISILKKLR
ncbi:MAG: SIS domain-containing protein, partial [Caldisericia bacterium]|nr:SIS domain-containing protein [Caldisericia bacterium]